MSKHTIELQKDLLVLPKIVAVTKPWDSVGNGNGWIFHVYMEGTQDSFAYAFNNEENECKTQYQLLVEAIENSYT